MKQYLLRVILFPLCVCYVQAQDKPKMEVTLREISDTTFLSRVAYWEKGILHGDSGYMIRSGMGSDMLEKKFVNDPVMRIFIYPAREIRFDDLWDVRLKGKDGKKP